MSKRKIVKGVMLTTNGEFKVVKVKDHYEEFKKLLGIEDSPVDVQTRKVGGKSYDFWLDDEGLYKTKDGTLNGTCLCTDAAEIFVGNVLILRANNDGECESLTEEDIKNLQEHYIERKDIKGYSTCVGTFVVKLNNRLEYTIR